MFYNEPFSYWFYLGTIYLAWLTWQDHRNNMLIDDRKNYFMLGVTISLLSHLNNSLIYNIAALVIAQVLFYLYKRIKPLGEGDISAIRWCFLGFALIGAQAIVVYALVVSVLTGLYFGIKMVLGHSEYTPFFITLLGSFIVTAIVIKIY